MAAHLSAISSERASRAMSIALGGSVETAALSVPSPRRRITPASPSLASRMRHDLVEPRQVGGPHRVQQPLEVSLRSASSSTLAWARRNSSQISTTRSAVFSAISLRL